MAGNDRLNKPPTATTLVKDDTASGEWPPVSQIGNSDVPASNVDDILRGLISNSSEHIPADSRFPLPSSVSSAVPAQPAAVRPAVFVPGFGHEKHDAPLEPKYEFTDETAKTITGSDVRRIRALRSFGEGEDRVEAGQLGGFLQSQRNLSHEGNAWVADEAQVFDKAHIAGNARVSGKAVVCNDAYVEDNARITDEAWITQGTHVNGNKKIGGDAFEIGGSADHVVSMPDESGSRTPPALKDKSASTRLLKSTPAPESGERPRRLSARKPHLKFSHLHRKRGSRDAEAEPSQEKAASVYDNISIETSGLAAGGAHDSTLPIGSSQPAKEEHSGNQRLSVYNPDRLTGGRGR